MEKNNKVKGEGREDGKNKNKYYAYFFNFLCRVIKQIEAFLYTTHRYLHTEIKS